MQSQFALLAARLSPPLPDGELLKRYALSRDEVAFAALVQRHGPAVYGVCRRLLGNPADADDAFQAVFIVLMNRAGSLADRVSLGGWLHGVSVRVASKARTAFARLRKHERRAAGARPERVFDPPATDQPTGWIDRELAALPERLREPVLQCLVRERPRAEVAAELGIPEGTLASRLDAARKRLTTRLGQNRLPLAFAGLLASVPSTLADAVVDRASGTVGTDDAANLLASEVVRGMLISPKWCAAGTAGLLATAGGLLFAAGAADPSAPKPAAQAKPAPAVAADRQPAEPSWMPGFRKAYELKEGEYVKRVAPPYIDERKHFMIRELGPAMRITYNGSETRARSLDETLSFDSAFIEYDGKRFTKVAAYPTGAFRVSYKNDPIWRLWQTRSAVSDITKLRRPDVVFDVNAEPDVFTSDKRWQTGEAFADDGTTGIGDLVFRKDAPLDKLVPQLETVLREECGFDVRLTIKREEQPVYVVGGNLRAVPPDRQPLKPLRLLSAEPGRDGKSGGSDPNRATDRPVQSVTAGTNSRTGTSTELLRDVGDCLGVRMVWDTPPPAEPKVTWLSPATRTEKSGPVPPHPDSETVLGDLASQTGLTFTKGRRKVDTLTVSMSAAKPSASPDKPAQKPKPQ